MLVTKVKLLQCWRWKCPACLHINFHDGNRVKESEVRAMAKEILGTEDCVTYPDDVWCNKCGDSYKTETPTDELPDQGSNGYFP